jgi:hypothetical protein
LSGILDSILLRQRESRKEERKRERNAEQISKKCWKTHAGFTDGVSIRDRFPSKQNSDKKILGQLRRSIQ